MPLVDRSVYPEAEYPAGQWDYQLFYEESFDKACKGFEANIRNVVKALFRKGSPDAVGKPARTAAVRKAGGWLGGGAWPDLPRDADVLTEQDMEAYIAALTRNGFFGPELLVHESQAQRRLRQACAERRQARDAGAVPARPLRPDLRDRALPLAEPMRGDCADLTEVVVKSGHWMAQEKPVDVNAALARWLATKLPDYWKKP